MQNYNPFISICIFTYNRAEYIKETIESALAQSYTNYEIVIVNDGSTDNTEEVVKSIKSDKIRYFKKEHTNAPDTRNRALKEAKGDYILWLGDDDLLHEDILKIYVEYLNKYPDADILYCKLIAFNEKQGVLRQFVYTDWYNKKDELAAFLIMGQPIPDGSSLLNRKIYDEIGNFNVEFNRAQDYEFYSRVFITKKYNAKYVDEFLVKYRIHEKNITLNLSGKINYNYEVKILRKLISNNDLSIFFPKLKNKENYKTFLAESYYILGIKFFNYGAYGDSIFYLTASLREDKNLERLNNAIQGFIDAGVIEELKIFMYMVKGLFEGNKDIDKVIEIINNYKE